MAIHSKSSQVHHWSYVDLGLLLAGVWRRPFLLLWKWQASLQRVNYYEALTE